MLKPITCHFSLVAIVSADYYELRATPESFHVDKYGGLDNTVTISLWHVKGGTRTQVKEDTAAVELSATVGGTAWSATTRYAQDGELDLDNTMNDAGDLDDTQRTYLIEELIENGNAKEITVSDMTHGAASIKIGVTRDGATGDQGDAGADALYLDCDPAAVVWNQEGEITVDSDSFTPKGTPSWPTKYIHARVRRGSVYESGWKITVSFNGFTAQVGTYNESSGTFLTNDAGTGEWIALSNPVKIGTASNLWTNGTLGVYANKTGESQLTRYVPIALNALGTWKLNVINDTATAASNKITTEFTDKGLEGSGYDTTIQSMQATISQNSEKISANVTSIENNTAGLSSMNKRVGEIEVKSSEISLMVTSMRSGRNLWIDGGFDMADGVRPTWVHNQSSDADGKDSESISDTDVPAGFNHSLVFTSRKANNGIYFTKEQQPYAVPTTAVPYCLSFWARSTMACKMAVGLENVALGYADLTTTWQRFAIYYSADSDYSKWSGATVFYPMTALVDSNGNSGNVYLTGIQFETGTDESGAPTAWSESVFDLMKTGIDIRNGVIRAIAEMFSWEDASGNKIAEFTTEGAVFHSNLVNILGDLKMSGSFWGQFRRKAVTIDSENWRAYITEEKNDASGGYDYSIKLTEVGSYVIFSADFDNAQGTGNTNIASQGVSVALPSIDGSWVDKELTDAEFEAECEEARQWVGARIMVVNQSSAEIGFSNVANKAGRKTTTINGLTAWTYTAPQESFTLKTGYCATFDCVAQDGLYYPTGTTTAGALEMEFITWEYSQYMLANKGYTHYYS